MTYAMDQWRQSEALAADLVAEQRAEELLKDAGVIGEITSDIASNDEDALNLAIQQAISGDTTRLNQMFWDSAMTLADEELKQPESARLHCNL